MSKGAQVLSIYRRIFRVARDWHGNPGEDEYIRQEARYLFKKNSEITDPAAIDRKIDEAQMRVELGLHYRYVHFSSNTIRG